VELEWPNIKRSASYLHVKQLISPGEVASILAAIPEELDEDHDSVDGMASFEFVLHRKDMFGDVRAVGAKPDHDPTVYEARKPVRERLHALTDSIVQERITPMVNERVHSCAGRCVACHSLVRRYLQSERRSHGTHFDIQALATVVVGLNKYGVDFEGGLYVTTSQGKMSFLALDAGDAVYHESDLLHGVEVTKGSRWSWILWYTDAPDCKAEPGQWHLKEALEGDPVAQFLRAKRSHMSRDFRHNATAEKAMWMRRAAEAGFGRAMNEFGMMHEEGDGVEQDLAEARAWFKKAKTTEGDAQYNLGRLELAASPPSIAAAVSYFRQGAAMGSRLAMHNLAVAYIKGAPGLAKSDTEAMRWFEKAGNEAGMWQIHKILARDPEAIQKAEMWLRRAAQAGHAGACRKLAVRANKSADVGGKPNAEAMKWLRKAAMSGDGASQNFLMGLERQQQKEQQRREL